MKRLYEYLCALEATIAGSFLILMVALIFVGGLARLAHFPLNWTIDLATCLFAWACFLSADIAWRRNSMMSIEVITSRLPSRLQGAFRLVNYALISAFLVYLIIMGIYLSWISRGRSFQGIPEVSYSWITMSLPVGALLLLITTVLKIRAESRGEHTKGQTFHVL